MKWGSGIAPAILFGVFKPRVLFDVNRFTGVIPYISRCLRIKKDYVFRVPVTFSLEVLRVAFNASDVVNETVVPKNIVHEAFNIMPHL